MTERLGLELDTLTIRIPIRLQRRGGRKLIMTPEGSAVPTLSGDIINWPPGDTKN